MKRVLIPALWAVLTVVAVSAGLLALILSIYGNPNEPLLWKTAAVTTLAALACYGPPPTYVTCD